MVLLFLPRYVHRSSLARQACNRHQTIVACGSTFVHYNASIFPRPDDFVPERWLESDELDEWLVAFSRGPRMCLGIK